MSRDKSKTPYKFSQAEKEDVQKIINDALLQLPRLKEKTNRVVIRGGRVYLYELVKQFMPEMGYYDKPLICGKYLEFPLVRITIHDKFYKNCTLSWQRHNEQWLDIVEGSLIECLENAEKMDWF